jgi:hypothetical protein
VLDLLRKGDVLMVQDISASTWSRLVLRSSSRKAPPIEDFNQLVMLNIDSIFYTTISLTILPTSFVAGGLWPMSRVCRLVKKPRR